MWPPSRTHTVAELKEATTDIDARLCGLISKLEVRISQKDKTPWARATLEDRTGAVEFLVFQPLYGQLSRPLTVGDVVVVSGQLSRRE